MTALPPLLQGFFTDRLIGQRDASPHTIAAYRDCFRLLLVFVHEHTGKPPSKLLLDDLDAVTISGFLAHLEQARGNSVRTRNARLTAIRSFFHYAALKTPEQAELIARVLSIPEKRFDTTEINYLTEIEIAALLRAPDPSIWTGRRDPRDASARRADRATSQRTRSPLLPRPATRRHRMGQMPRQRPQDEMHAHHPADQSRPPRVVT